MSELLQSFKDHSPWLIGFLAVIWLLNKFLGFLKARKTESAAELNDRAHDRIERQLVSHDEKLSRYMQDNLSTSKGIEQQLMISNSKQGTVLSAHNQKKMIEYQISWCRNMVTSVIVNSVIRNNIAGREDIVVRKVVRAFKSAAHEAQESLDSLEGLTYRYTAFFDEQLPQIWPLILRAAMPLYHRDFPEGMTVDDAVEDLTFRIQGWFEEALKKVIAQSEDPETGSIYHSSDGDTAEIDGYLPLAVELRSYQPREELE